MKRNIITLSLNFIETFNHLTVFILPYCIKKLQYCVLFYIKKMYNQIDYRNSNQQSKLFYVLKWLIYVYILKWKNGIFTRKSMETINKNYPSRIRAKLLSVFKEGIGHLFKPRLYRKNPKSGHLTVRFMFWFGHRENFLYATQHRNRERLGAKIFVSFFNRGS